MAILIFERALELNPDTGEVESYWPERWPVDELLNQLMSMGALYFSATYMNNPTDDEAMHTEAGSDRLEQHD